MKWVGFGAYTDYVHGFLIISQIEAVNTIIRRSSDGKTVGYNTNCDACITAIEDAIQGRMITYAIMIVMLALLQ
ncbi:3-dehydroquinate dehydratase type I [Artemisia annua]|uniref:3-dehydroquinate dehydratase type I n=1 Tax=Artemisia annua TaxID=35608 RepID=A0A2U1KUL8_ARTAN|nr:3-dehydroquinate dehydratase type I [Artemisia annua]